MNQYDNSVSSLKLYFMLGRRLVRLVGLDENLGRDV